LIRVRATSTRNISFLAFVIARADLRDAGCVAVFLDPQGFRGAIADKAELAPAAHSSALGARLEHFQAKWIPVRR
jgi:hypothetical protein